MRRLQYHQKVPRVDKVILSVLFILFLFVCCRQEGGYQTGRKFDKPDIQQLYSRVYKFLGYKEYEIAFSELERMLPLYNESELKWFDLQNLFARYIIDGEDSLDNIVRNFTRFFRFFDSSDAEGIYQLIVYRASLYSELEKLPVVAESIVNNVDSPIGLYFILTKVYLNFRQKEKANEYLDCLLNLAPGHPAISRLVFDVRGKKAEFRAQSVNSLRDMFYNDNSYLNLETIALNFHISSMIHGEWRDIGWSLLRNRDYRLRQIAYSEIPIFFAREGDSEALYELLREAIRLEDYTLFRLASRSLLYVHPEPQSVVGRLKVEFSEHPYIYTLYAKYLLNLSLDNLKESTEWYIKALERENNLEIFYEAVDLFRRTSEFFKLKAFAEELLYMYPYEGELYKIYSEINGGDVDRERLMRYFEQLPVSVDRYSLYFHLFSNPKDKEDILIEGMRVFPGDCTLILQLLNLYRDCRFKRFTEIYKGEIKEILDQNDLSRCLDYLNSDARKVFVSMINSGKRDGCDDGK